MLVVNDIIDSIQSSKKHFLNVFVTNEDVKQSLLTFVDAQTEYTKNFVKVSNDTATTVAQQMVKAVQQAAKFDYSKFGEGIMKAYQSQNNIQKPTVM